MHAYPEGRWTCWENPSIRSTLGQSTRQTKRHHGAFFVTEPHIAYLVHASYIFQRTFFKNPWSRTTKQSETLPTSVHLMLTQMLAHCLIPHWEAWAHIPVDFEEQRSNQVLSTIRPKQASIPSNRNFSNSQFLSNRQFFKSFEMQMFYLFLWKDDMVNCVL